MDKKYEAAIDKYTEALDLEPTGTLLWEIISNRSLAYTSSRDYTNGLMDANKLIDIAPRFKRSYPRKRSRRNAFANFSSCAPGPTPTS